jgi:dihydroflavonol-4-reductase
MDGTRMAQTVLITGISGFIAKHVAARFLQAGYHVRGTIRRSDREVEVRKAVLPAAGPDAADRLTFAVADLERDAGWAEALAGVDVLVHTASPFPIAQPKDESDLIRPAVQGTERVLRAAKAAGVTRVVLTSSVVAVLNESKTGVQDESDWCDVALPTTTAYGKSKTLAERRAWEIARTEGLALTTINPGFVLGPPLDEHYGSSLGIVERFLKGKDPMQPPFGLPVVDVRDVAEMHLRAVQRPDTSGLRIIASAGSMTFVEMAQVLKAAYPDRRIATRAAPKFALRLLALFDPSIRSILPKLGITERVSNARAVVVLGMVFAKPDQALRDAAAWLVAKGKV